MEQSTPASLAEALASAVDEEFYLHFYGEIPHDVTPSAHYANIGWREGYDPNPWFSTEDYLRDYPDISEAELVPLFHYLEYGAAEGRIAKPSHLAELYLGRHGEQ